MFSNGLLYRHISIGCPAVCILSRGPTKSDSQLGWMARKRVEKFMLLAHFDDNNMVYKYKNEIIFFADSFFFLTEA